jgi:hypothetical protein
MILIRPVVKLLFLCLQKPVQEYLPRSVTCASAKNHGHTVHACIIVV